MTRDPSIVLRQLRAASPVCAAALALLAACTAADPGTTAAFGWPCPDDDPDCAMADPGGGGSNDDSAATADLGIQKQAIGPFVAGGLATFELGVYNNGPVAVSPVIVTDVLDPGFIFVSASPNPPWSCIATAAPPQTVTCTYTAGALPAYTAVLPITLTVQVVGRDTLTNCATVGGVRDRYPHDNRACVEVEIAGCAPLAHDLSTGIYNATGAPIPAGNGDETWRIVSSPLGAVQPRVNAQFWNALPGSKWIAPTLTASNIPVSNAPGGDYVYETCFCLSSDYSNAALSLTMQADNYVGAVTLNQCTLFSGVAGEFNVAPLDVQSDDHDCFRPGENCVQIEVHNYDSSYTGLDVTGTITADNDGTCCPSGC